MADVKWWVTHLTDEEKAENEKLKKLHARGRAKSFKLNKPKTGRERASIKEKKLTPASETVEATLSPYKKRRRAEVNLAPYKKRRRAMGRKPPPPIRHDTEIYGYKTGGTIKRMTGGVGHKTTKGTSVEDIERMRKDWEEAPMKGTPGPYNPKKMRLKKKKDTSVTIKKLPTSRKQAMSANERKELIGIGAHPGDIKGTVEHKKWQREKKRAAEQTPATQAKTGGTVKRKSGGALGTGAALRGFGRGYKKGGTI